MSTKLAERLTVWNLQTLREVVTLPKASAAPFPGTLRFANDSQSIAVANTDGTVEVWKLAGKKHIGPWQAHREPATAVAFMPGGKVLLTASCDSTIRLWNIETQKELRRFLRTENAYKAAAVSADGTRVAAAAWGREPCLIVWNVDTGQEVARFQGYGEYLAFLADGNTLLSGFDEEVRQEVRLWRAPSWAEIGAAEKQTEQKTR